MYAPETIPKEAKIDVDRPDYLDEVENFATDDEIKGKVVGAVEDYEMRFNAQREDWINSSYGIWTLADWAFHACINDAIAQSEKSKGANEPDLWERAKTGTTQFYRQVTQKAANLYAVYTSKDVPFKYRPLLSDGVDDPAIAEAKARKKNLLAKYTMKKDKLDRKTIEFATQIYKYGNTPVLVEWCEKRKRITEERPVFDPENPGKIIEYNSVTTMIREGGYPSITILPVEGVKADTNIGSIQKQDCVVLCTVVGLSEIVDGIEDGIYREDLLEDLSRSHQWDGYTGFENLDEKADNRGSVSDMRTGSGQYLKREVFINVPIDEEKKTWNELKNVPRRFRVTMFGNCPGDSLVARIERNQEPDDAIPMEMIHCNPDDCDLLYHISNIEVVRSNIATETTLIRQAIDSNSQANKPVLWEIEGAVKRGTDGINDRKWGPNQHFILYDKEGIGMLETRDISQTTIAILDYLKEDSNTANSLDKNQVGESFGARTSGTEASNINAATRRPNLVGVEYILEQYLGFIAWRYDVLWQAYATPDQVIQITDENDQTVAIKPSETVGEYDIVVDIINDIRDDEVKAQRMLNGAQVFSQIPQLAAITDWEGLGKDLQQHIFGTSKYVVSGGLTGDAENNAQRNVVMMLEYGQFPEMNDAMDLKLHLKVYKEARTQWQGYEDQNPNVEILDQVIAQIEQRFQAIPMGGAGTPAIAQPAMEATQNGRLQSAALGGVQ